MVNCKDSLIGNCEGSIMVKTKIDYRTNLYKIIQYKGRVKDTLK
jgi:hypothetical protein